MKTIILILLFAAFHCNSVYGDAVPMTQPEQQLYTAITSTKALPKRNDVIEALNSSHHLLHLEAIKWLILNRDVELWNTFKSEKARLSGTALTLSKILDVIDANHIPANTPLALALGHEDLSLMIAIDREKPPKFKDSDPPVSDVLYELLARDMEMAAIPEARRVEAAKLLTRFHAPTKLLQESVKARASDTAPK